MALCHGKETPEANNKLYNNEQDYFDIFRLRSK